MNHISRQQLPPPPFPGQAPKNAVIKLPGNLEAEVVGLKIGNKTLASERLINIEKAALETLVRAAFPEKISAHLSHLRFDFNFKNANATVILKIKKLKAEVTRGIPIRESTAQEPLKEKYAEFLDAFQDAITSQNQMDEYPSTELRMPAEARRMARDFTPIEKRFIMNGKDYGTEKITKFRTVLTAIRSAKESIRYFEKKKEELELKQQREKLEASKKHLSSQIAECDRAIQYFETALKNLATLRRVDDKGWLDCNYFRFLVRDCHDYDKAVKEYVSAPINMRLQSYGLNNKREAAVIRLGVMADMRNTWYSLADLKAIQQEFQNKNLKPNESYLKPYEMLKSHVDHILKVGMKAVVKGNWLKRKFSRNDFNDQMTKLCGKHSLHNLGKIIDLLETEIAKIKGKPSFKAFKRQCRLQSMLHALKELNSIYNEGTVNHVIADRRMVLRNQFMQLTAAQVANNPHLLKNSCFNLAHVGLLCGNKKGKFDETGWMNDEAVEMADMSEIFAEFDGRQIVFESRESAPFVDLDGNIHLPETPGAKKGSRRTLRTVYVNVTPQGYPTGGIDTPVGGYLAGEKDNIGIQKELNIKAMNKLKPQTDKKRISDVRDTTRLPPIMMPKKSWEQIKFLADFKEGSFQLAEQAASAFINSGMFATSVCCGSGKDRTGLTLEGIILKFIEQKDKKAAKHFSNQVLVADPLTNPASRIVYENSGEKAMKANPLDAPRAPLKKRLAALGPFVRATKMKTPAMKQWKKQKKIEWKTAPQGETPTLYPFKRHSAKPISDS